MTGRFDVVGGTEHALGGGVADPPGWGTEEPGELRRWVRAVHEYVLARAAGEDPGWIAPWDEGAEQPFPVLRRFSAASPETLVEVPAAVGLHPFGPWIEGEPDKVLADRVAVTLDPGDDLAGWATLRWVDRNGEHVRVGTTSPRHVDIVFRTLSDYAWNWAQPAPPDDDTLVEIDPRLIRRVGRGGALVDAQLADPNARAQDHQVVYSEGDPWDFVVEEARRLGPRPFARLTGLPIRVAERVALGRPITGTNVEKALRALTERSGSDVRSCVLDGCERPVTRPNARFCSKAHRDAAYRKRQQAYGAPTCAKCDALMLGAADTGTGFCVDCAEVP